jgi:hypothetical protein
MVGGVEIEIWIFSQALMAWPQMQVAKRLAAQKRGTGQRLWMLGRGWKKWMLIGWVWGEQ